MIGNRGFGEIKIQDQTTQPVNTLFLQSISNFSISSDTGESTISSLLYTFNATAGHGLVIGNEILLLNTETNRDLFAIVKNVAINLITIDRPIDHDFKALTTLGRIVRSNMNVNGSVTPQIFSIRAGMIPTDFTQFIITMTSTSAMDDGKFGSLAELSRGLVFRIIDSFHKTIFCFKRNGCIAQYSFNTKYPDKSPSGTYAFNANLIFNGLENRGVVLRIKDTDVIQFVVQDDLTGLSSLKISAIGHLTDDRF